jgi:HSP20 family molecular chaperone IbpA
MSSSTACSARASIAWKNRTTTWAPAVDILETEQELVVKADLPEIDPKELDIRVETIS